MKIMKYRNFKIPMLLLLFFLCSACEKYLDEKSDMTVRVPQDITDLRLMLDNVRVINESTPGLIEMGTDDYELTYANYNRLSVFARDVYLWKQPLYFQSPDVTLQWMNTYTCILIANVVQESLKRIAGGTQHERNTLEGEALFVQAFAYYHLAQIYAAPFVPGTANDGPGVVYRPNSDFNETSYRLSIADSYQLIIDQLMRAATLLPESSGYKTRPNKQAAYAFLARVYLAMEYYAQALEYANIALSFRDKLSDYNAYPINATNPFKQIAEDVIYYAITTGTLTITNTRSFVPIGLYEEYSDTDLRKSLFFVKNAQGQVLFQGSYSGSITVVFNGLAIDELYYIKAESELRTGLQLEAVETINKLLATRWKVGSYVPLVAATPDETLKFILMERRKGLLFRGLRWSDLRRLNRDLRFDKTLTRSFVDNDLTASLLPNDPRYIFPLPDWVVDRAGVKQN